MTSTGTSTASAAARPSAHDTSEDLLAAASGTVRVAQRAPLDDRDGVVPTVFESFPTTSGAARGTAPTGARMAGWSLSTRLLIIGGWFMIIIQGALLFQAVGVLDRVVSSVANEEMYRWYPAPVVPPPAEELLDPQHFNELIRAQPEQALALQRLRAHALIEYADGDRGRALQARLAFAELQTQPLLWRPEDRIAFAEAALASGRPALALTQANLASATIAHLTASSGEQVEQVLPAGWGERLRQVRQGAILAAR